MLKHFLRWLPLERIEGYEHPDLIDVIFKKTIAYEPRGAWPEIDGAQTVLDFGGGCGLHYKQAKLPNCRWAVVETPAMVMKAKELETRNLRFFTSISEAAIWLGQIDIMHSNGAIQCTPSPLDTLRELIETNPNRLLWYRLNFGNGAENQVSRLADNGPGKAVNIKHKLVRYPVRGIPEDTFISAHAKFRLESRGIDWFRFSKLF
jgi:putative methyltransferase (TIGR04325 family)